MKKRCEEIDILRGIAILFMILIHTSYYFIADKTALFLWNWSQFAVPVFVFCSSYLFFQKYRCTNISFVQYLKKRVVRLIIPYYIFLAFFLSVVLFLTPRKITINYILQSIFFIGGVDINWLVLLFLCFAFLFPFIVHSFRKKKMLFVCYMVASFASSILFVLYSPSFSYKWFMWLPWSTIPFFSLFFVLYEKRKLFIFVSFIVLLFLFLSTYQIERALHHQVGFFQNKYPPNIYFLLYGMLSIIVLYFLARFILLSVWLTALANFFSRYSYSLYFIHYVVLIVGASLLHIFSFNWFTFFVSVLSATVAIQFGNNFISQIIITRNA